MKATPEFLRFELMPRASGRRTDMWHVTNRAGTYLGRIGWYGPWRQYVFYPASGSLWSGGCQLAVVDFIVQQMTARQARAVG